MLLEGAWQMYDGMIRLPKFDGWSLCPGGFSLHRRYRFMNFRGCQIRARYCIVEVEVGFRVVAQNMATAVVDLTCVTRYRKPLVRKDAAQRFDWLMQGEYNRWDGRVRVLRTGV